MPRKKIKKQPKIRVDRKIYFYRAVSALDKGGKPAFNPPGVFNAVRSLPWKERYKDEDGGKQTCCWLGEKISLPCSVKFGLIRRTDLPQRESGGRLWPLKMARGSGLAEKIHVVFFENNIIGADYNFYGPSMAKFAEYLLLKGKQLEKAGNASIKKRSKNRIEIPKGLRFEPLLRGDVVDQLDKMQEIRLFRLRIRKSFAANLSDASRSLAAAFKAASRAGRADNVEIILRTPSHSKDWLGKNILDAAKKIIRIPGLQHEALHFSVKGLRDDSAKTTELDLLSDKLISTQSICLMNSRTKILESRSAFSAIKNAHKKLKKALENAPSVSYG
ncbi:MAG: hypothetical protein HZB50_06345 [Chloroflexi bacterium]|nr:hypothetical protein [Chloroflexota bacterium]